ncbi:DNA (cytosine-5-)-methyltransferase [Halarcobacter ebronensis]|uniref:Cytosine-specific methyltransferase n=1 Tax=Halarcobacter ebronensis TaxID=1462615 RepID=A0A4Q0Y985_9BACT|nr:DNA (cytosine-5-)-methyltransferase [Halarcobacter ebronensis]RXJ66792.1 DNA (cytosine-5-)-methyltransferase [Halarcobacter ebronensis]
MKTPNLFNIYQKAEEQNNMNTEMVIKTQTIRTIELFAGVGGFRIGLERVKEKNKKFQIVWSNQWEPSTKTQHASDVYCARFGYENHSNEDISTVDVSEIPTHDLLVGGFPCQDYSVASTLKNSHGIVGKKGVLWWEIYRILEEKKDEAPKYLLLENVDRLLKSPALQRGRDFAIILSSLNNLGYAVEWRVINASDYGMPQRRKRIFIFATKIDTKSYKIISDNLPKIVVNEKGLFAKAFPIKKVEENNFIYGKLSNDLVDITNNFNKMTPKKNSFLEAGIMINGEYWTTKYESKYEGEKIVLGQLLEDEKNIPEEFFINESELEKWKYQKGAKSIERVNKTTGHKYLYSEGSMGFPDCLEKPARTIITGEGGASPSRFKHVIKVHNRYRRLTPIELERLNMFPDNHTLGVSNSKRAFLMGNALVVGIVEKLGDGILRMS